MTHEPLPAAGRLDLLIRGGEVVTPGSVGPQDIGIIGSRISLVGEPGTLGSKAARVVDATGKIVIPGGIEPHVHCTLRLPTTVTPTFAGIVSGGPSEVTRAAIFGGTTTVIDFAHWRPGIDLMQAIAEKDTEFSGASFTDYTYHCTLYSQKGDLPFPVIEQVRDVVAAGYPSIKVFTSNVTPTRPKQMTDMGHIMAIMEQTIRAGGILAVHAEDDEIVMFDYKRLTYEGKVGTEYLHLAHSNISEDLSFRRIIRLAELLGGAVYLMHVSAREGVDAIAEARARRLPIYGETIQTYTGFTYEAYKAPDGALYHTHPSLKSEADRQALWHGLIEGSISTLATDESFNTRATKMRGKTINDTTGGASAVEARVGIAYSEGVVKRGMSLERFVDITSANAARILGLYPRKGAIQPGSDADLAIIDPTIKRRLTASELHGSDYTVWEGWDVAGWPVTTILRGKVMVDNGTLLGTADDGQFVPRKIDPRVIRGPVC